MKCSPTACTSSVGWGQPPKGLHALFRVVDRNLMNILRLVYLSSLNKILYNLHLYLMFHACSFYCEGLLICDHIYNLFVLLVNISTVKSLFLVLKV